MCGVFGIDREPQEGLGLAEEGMGMGETLEAPFPPEGGLVSEQSFHSFLPSFFRNTDPFFPLKKLSLSCPSPGFFLEREAREGNLFHV